jgi:hypothetical protein
LLVIRSHIGTLVRSDTVRITIDRGKRKMEPPVVLGEAQEAGVEGRAPPFENREKWGTPGFIFFQRHIEPGEMGHPPKNRKPYDNWFQVSSRSSSPT